MNNLEYNDLMQCARKRARKRIVFNNNPKKIAHYEHLNYITEAPNR